MGLQETLQHDLVSALKAKDSVAISALRGLKAALQQEEIDKGSLDDGRAFAIVKQQIKQRQDSVTAYTDGKRPDLAEQELAEIEVIKRYQPEQLTGDALREKVSVIVAASDVKDFGPLMGKVMAELQNQADGNEVKQLLNELLQGYNA